jgi:uncharacterized protein (DUF2164 family)
VTKIEFNKDEKAHMVRKLKLYFTEELEQEIGQFDAEFLLDFLSEELGVYYYNRGLNDARIILESKFSDMEDALYEIEHVTEFTR